MALRPRPRRSARLAVLTASGLALSALVGPAAAANAAPAPPATPTPAATPAAPATQTAAATGASGSDLATRATALADEVTARWAAVQLP
ncbi:MAG: hypothetical protein REI11_07510, partial [Patulibacter sp.]|nr:hypothetical protein [Patulibacter sp.]